ncbi:MAG: DUF5009 domain-containing protein [Planctomycetes bacterium]|nr:DUF5009 domain-containing protein [Planctomycetota bacterium]
MTEPRPEPPPTRLVSLDAYRGFVMLAMCSTGFGVRDIATNLPENKLWTALSYQFSHVAWVGCAFWDLIQPSFMFMVGVSLPFSYASRIAKGKSRSSIAGHMVYRAVLLVLLATFLASSQSDQTSWRFTNVLGQIGLGYAILFPFLGRSLRTQAIVLALILFGYWLAFALYPLRPDDFDYTTVGVAADFPLLDGFFAHWNKNTNLAADFDAWFLNLFPGKEPFAYSGGGYQTLSFVPSLGTMLLGLMAGELLRSSRRPKEKVRFLLISGVACLIVGALLGWTLCPIVKRIWTPSWVLFAGGWTFLMLGTFYVVIEMWGWTRWAFPFVVVGMNSITIYLMSLLLKGWISQRLTAHLGEQTFAGTYGPFFLSALVVFCLWLVCWWMYRRKIFLRL